MGLSPHELRTASLSVLITAAQANHLHDTPEMNEVIRRFEPLARRLSYGLARNHLQDDVANAARLGLVRAVRRHDNTHPGFAAYARRYMTGAALRELKRWQAEQAIAAERLDESEAFAIGYSQQSVMDRLAPWGEGSVATSIDKLSLTQQRIATLRYVHDAPLEIIARATGTSVSAVSQRLATIHRRVSLGLAA
jgi:RNA polymerase sigma factor (sigma-70 family)